MADVSLITEKYYRSGEDDYCLRYELTEKRVSRDTVYGVRVIEFKKDKRELIFLDEECDSEVSKDRKKVKDLIIKLAKNLVGPEMLLEGIDKYL